MSKKKKRFHFLKKVFITLFFLFCLMFLAGTAVFAYYVQDAPKLGNSKLEVAPSTKIYDAKGKLIDNLDDAKRDTIETDEIPQQLKDAIVSIEDRRFYKHIGIDPIRIIGAMFANLKGNSLQGGSTLTQQLIKLSYFSTKQEDQTIKRKVQEAYLSIKLERTKSKDQILDYYINKVYMDNHLYGMETAAKTYFHKNLKDLSLAQTALIAGMPQAPTSYNPYTNPKGAKNRRDTVLYAMYQNKKITKSEYEKARKVPITKGLKKLDDSESKNNNIIDNYVTEVIKEAKERTGKDPYKSGMSIYTNLDMSAQKYLYGLLNDNEKIEYPIENPHVTGDELKTAVTVMDVNNGKVIAQLGDRDVKGEVQRGQNLAVDGNRDVGSTTKPFTDYAPAIELLHLPTSQKIVDEPYFYSDSNMQVYNYDDLYKGTMTMKEALIDSRNVPAMKLFDAVGATKIEKFLKDRYDYSIEGGINQASAISQNMSTLKLASIYSSFANGGTYYKPYYISKIKFNDGSSEDYSKDGHKAISQSTAYMITNMLQGVTQPGGTASRTYIPSIYQAGKTGTSNYEKKVKSKIIGDKSGVPDVTMVGYTKEYCVSVWSGYSNYFRSLSPEYQHISQEVYYYMMSYLMKNKTSTPWKMPSDVVKIGNGLYQKGYTTNNGLLKSLYPQINKRVNKKNANKQKKANTKDQYIDQQNNISPNNTNTSINQQYQPEQEDQQEDQQEVQQNMGSITEQQNNMNPDVVAPNDNANVNPNIYIQQNPVGY